MGDVDDAALTGIVRGVAVGGILLLATAIAAATVVTNPRLLHLKKEAPRTIPPEVSLTEVSGQLLTPSGSNGVHSHIEFGRIQTDDGHVIGVSCEPHLDDVGCLYTTPYFESPDIGRRVTVKYFALPGSRYPRRQYGVVPENLRGRMLLDDTPINIAMVVDVDATGTFPGRSTTYQQSVQRLTNLDRWVEASGAAASSAP